MVSLKGPKIIYVLFLLRKLKINIRKTKFMISGKNCDDIEGGQGSGHVLLVGRVLEVTQSSVEGVVNGSISAAQV